MTGSDSFLARVLLKDEPRAADVSPRNSSVSLRAGSVAVLCCALLAIGCDEVPGAALANAEEAWARGDEDGVLASMTAPSAGTMRLLAFCDERFRVVPRRGAPAPERTTLDAAGRTSAVLARIAGTSGAVPLRLVHDDGTWRIDLVATEALARDVDARGVPR
jgi:hypothetical protein